MSAANTLPIDSTNFTYDGFFTRMDARTEAKRWAGKYCSEWDIREDVKDSFMGVPTTGSFRLIIYGWKDPKNVPSGFSAEGRR